MDSDDDDDDEDEDDEEDDENDDVEWWYNGSVQHVFLYYYFIYTKSALCLPKVFQAAGATFVKFYYSKVWWYEKLFLCVKTKIKRRS